MSLGIGGLGFGTGGATGSSDPSDLGLGLFGSISGVEDDPEVALNTPSLSLSKLGTGFDQEITAAMRQMQAQNLNLPPTSQEIEGALTAIDKKQPLNEEQIKTMADRFLAFGEQAASAVSGGMQSFIALQESIVGLQRLVEDYASKEAAASLGGLYGKIDPKSTAHAFVKDTITKWTRVDFFAFSSVTGKESLSDEGKREKTRAIQYMLFISLQVNLDEQDPLLQICRESAYMDEAFEQNGPETKPAMPIIVSDDPNASTLAASEQRGVGIETLNI